MEWFKKAQKKFKDLTSAKHGVNKFDVDYLKKQNGEEDDQTTYCYSRPEGDLKLTKRAKYAWAIFKGKADVIYWKEEENETMEEK